MSSYISLTFSFPIGILKVFLLETISSVFALYTSSEILIKKFASPLFQRTVPVLSASLKGKERKSVTKTVRIVIMIWIIMIVMSHNMQILLLVFANSRYLRAVG